MLKLLPLLLSLTLAACATTKDKLNIDDKNKKSESIPKITKPSFKKVWIPEEIRNNGTEYVEGHFMYVIERDTTWSK